jgi:hypothetical protein
VSRNIQRRLNKLEELATPYESSPLVAFPDWPFDDQAEDMMDALLLHRCAGSVQLCTDREVNVLGILHAFFRLPDDEGEHQMASGVVVSLARNGSKFDICLSGNVSVEDLPKGVQRHIQRIDPEKQPERERWLYEQRDRPRQRSFLEKYSSLAVEMVRGEGGALVE